MKRKEAVVRHYSQPDADMQQDMRTMRGHYLTYETRFRAFNPEFDAAYGAEWLAAIEAAEAAPTHTVRAGELKEHTGTVGTAMDQAQAALQTLFYYVGRAFPGNVGHLDQYGRRRYAAARDDQDQMQALLRTAHAAATRDQAALAAKGYAASQLAALAALGPQLTTANTEQELKKGTNTEDTDHYLTLQNLAYGYGQEVSTAAKRLFAEEAATRRLFRLGGDDDDGGPNEQPGAAKPGA